MLDDPYLIIAAVKSEADTAIADRALDKLGIRGGWISPLPLTPCWSYCGYDYNRQRWITTGVYRESAIPVI